MATGGRVFPLCILALILWDTTAFGREEPAAPSEYAVKAAFLYNLTRFVEWPSDVPAAESRPFVVAILGEDPFGTVLDDTLADKSVLGRKLVLRHLSKPDDATGVQVLFIAASESRRLAQVLQAVGTTGVLTVGEMEDFAQQGGMVGFRMSGRKVRLDINLAQAARSHLRISSELLKLARVIGAAEAGH